MRQVHRLKLLTQGLLLLFCLNGPDAAGQAPADSQKTALSFALEGAALNLDEAELFVRRVFEQKDSSRYDEATEVYLTLLENMDRDLPPAGEILRRRLLEPLAMILPDSVLAAAGLTGSPLLRLAPGQGARLLKWWRSADLLSATPENERLTEHLERVAYARAHYTDRDGSFDDRAPVYIRFGPPSHETSIMLNEVELLDLNLVSGFPRHTFWVYRQVHDRADYLFIDKPGAGYRLGLPYELIPTELRNRRSASRLLIKVMEDIYRTLALYQQRTHYGFLYHEIAGFRESLALNHARMTPEGFALTMLRRARMEDQQEIVRRDEEMPRSYSNLLDAVEPLPAALRWARFLEPDGTTQAEFYWDLRGEDLRPSRRLRRSLEKRGHQPSDEYILNLTVTRQDPDYRDQARETRHYRIRLPEDSLDASDVLPLQTFRLEGAATPYRVALQWDAFWTTAAKGDTAAGLGPKVKVGLQHIDSLRALQNDPARLEMSDLKLLRISGDVPPEQAMPYPYAAIPAGIPLGLYFEVYHLAPAADARTHYTVAYEVMRNEKRRKRGPQTEARTTYTGAEPTAQETILLNLNDQDGTGAVEITVQVTDETTGQSVARSLSFEGLP